MITIPKSHSGFNVDSFHCKIKMLAGSYSGYYDCGDNNKRWNISKVVERTHELPDDGCNVTFLDHKGFDQAKITGLLQTCGEKAILSVRDVKFIFDRHFTDGNILRCASTYDHNLFFLRSSKSQKIKVAVIYYEHSETIVDRHSRTWCMPDITWETTPEWHFMFGHLDRMSEWFRVTGGSVRIFLKT